MLRNVNLDCLRNLPKNSSNVILTYQMLLFQQLTTSLLPKCLWSRLQIFQNDLCMYRGFRKFLICGANCGKVYCRMKAYT